MTYQVDIRVMPLRELLDPQGKAVLGGLASLSIGTVTDVRVGKLVSLTVEAGSVAEARSIAEEASSRLLANPVMESYEVTVTA